MLPFQNRLTKKTDFQRAYRSRNSFFAEGLILKCVENNLPQSRVGFSVEKKFFKGAVERNTAKRKLREAVRPLLKKIAPGIDIVIIAKDPHAISNFQKLSENIEKLFAESKLLL